MSDNDETKPLPGHEMLTMVDQMKARTVAQRPTTNHLTGAVENPRREYMKNQIAYRQQRAATAMASANAKGMALPKPALRAPKIP